MKEITCDVCLDLMPLVQDGVASDDSCRLVEQHIEKCTNCRAVFDPTTATPEINDKKILMKIRKKLFAFAIGIVLFGAVIGIGLSDSAGVFYNILLMPAIGGIGYKVLHKKAVFIPAMLFVLAYFWLLIKYVLEGVFAQEFHLMLLTAPIYWSVVYALLSGVGILIGALLEFAFRKEA